MSQSGGDGKKLGSGGNGGRGEMKGKGIAAAGPADESPVWSSFRGQSSSDVEEDEGDAEVKAKTGFDSLAALENSFPMERGLFLAGRTKSYHNLDDAPMNYKDTLLKEHPNEKRRRLILAHLRQAGADLYRGQGGKMTTANVGPALPSDDQTNEEAAYDVVEEGKTASDDGSDDDI